MTNYQVVSSKDHPNRLKYRVSNNNILISSLRLAKSPALLFEGKDLSDYVFSNGFYVFRVKDGWNNKFVQYILRTRRLKNILDNHIYRGIGISSYKDEDLKKIKIPLFSELEQDQVVNRIKPIENIIKELKDQIKPLQEIINKVFVREFGFDSEEFEKLKQIKSYNLNFYSFANNKDIRQSVKFHRDAGYFVQKELKEITNKKIKNFIAEPIVLGKGISPKDYDENGDYYYISMANIKNWQFESEDTRLVSNGYSDQNKNKSIAKDDILIARSGEGTIGKVALIDDEDLLGIFADFTMRIRLKDCSPLFAYYYFRTDYFQYLIEINKKGLGNNTNIFPSQIQEFPMIDAPIDKQKEIIEEVKDEIDKQKEIKSVIQKERDKIDQIIENCIK